MSSQYDPNWTAEAKSGWCMANLHQFSDDGDHPEYPGEPGYCPLGPSKCGCGCHRDEPVARSRAWKPQENTEHDMD